MCQCSLNKINYFKNFLNIWLTYRILNVPEGWPERDGDLVRREKLFLLGIFIY